MAPRKPVDKRPGPSRTRALVGWTEYVALPDWGIPRIKAKADTGARTSALDVMNLEEIPGGRVRFTVPVSRNGRGRKAKVEALIARQAHVRSSFGHAHERYFVQTRIRIGLVEKVVEVSLVARDSMRCRMLLGRAALAPEFVVDPGRRYVYGTRRRKTP